MRKLTVFSAALILAVAGYFGTTGTARATLIYDITAEGPGTFGSFFSGSGTIEFSTLSGSDPSGLVDFSFSGEAPLRDFSYDASDVRRLDWSIDAFGVLTLNTLDAAATFVRGNTVFGCLALGSAGGLCETEVVDFDVDFPMIAESRGAAERRTLGPDNNGDLQFVVTTTAVGQVNTSQVPEPSALGILLAGFTGLAFVSARGRRRRSSNPSLA